MPSPVAHCLIGVSAMMALPPFSGRVPWQCRGLLLWGCALAILPDIDFLPGVVTGEQLRYHHWGTHSLVAGAVAGAGLGALWWKVRGGSLLWRVIGSTTVYWSHILLDVLTRDTYPGNGIGMPVFWPFSDTRVISPISLFYMRMHRGDYLSWEQAISLDNLAPFVVEWVVGLGLGYALLRLARWWRNATAGTGRPGDGGQA